MKQSQWHSATQTTAKGTGFTVVELITVLLLLGILSAFSVSKIFGPDSFSPSLAASESIALMRFALGQAQARQDVSVSFVLDQDASNWRFQVLSDRTGSPTVLRSTLVEHKSVAINITNGAVSVGLDASKALVIDLDGLGYIANGTAGLTVLNPEIGIDLDITGSSSFNICIGPGGYAFRGSCE